MEYFDFNPELTPADIEDVVKEITGKTPQISICQSSRLAFSIEGIIPKEQKDKIQKRLRAKYEGFY